MRCIITIILLFITNTSFTQALDKGNGNYLAIKEVVEKNNNTSSPEYIDLRSRYEFIDYAEKEKKELVIKKHSGISIDSGDIKSIHIYDPLFAPPGFIMHTVSFKIDKKRKKALESVFSDRIQKLIAIMINEEIFALATVQENVSTEFTVIVYGRNKEKLKNELSILTRNINIE